MSDMTQVKRDIGYAIVTKAHLVVRTMVSDYAVGIAWYRIRDEVWKPVRSNMADLIIDHAYVSHDSRAYEV